MGFKVKAWTSPQIRTGAASSTQRRRASRLMVAGLFATRAGDQTWYLKQKASIEDAEREVLVNTACRTAGFPVASIVPNDAGEPFALADDHAFMLTKALPGEELKDIGPRKGRLFGSSIASFQNALLDVPQGGFRSYDVPLSNLIERLSGLKGVDPDAERLIGLFEAFQDDDKLSRGLIHRDPHPGNMCFKDGALTGFIDFDLVKRGPRIFDPCYCATGQLAGSWHNEARKEVWFEFLAETIDGYFETVSPAFDERAHVFEMLLKIQLIFVVWLAETGQMETSTHNKRVLFWLVGKRDRIKESLGSSRAS